MKPIFVNTRPSIRQHPLPSLAKMACVVNVPLLDLVERTLSDDELDYQTNLMKGDYDALVVVSITAVEYAKAQLTDDEREHLCHLNQSGKLAIVAVGRPTADALAKLGLTAILPKVASNESMSQMAVFDGAKKVLFWRGVGGRVLLMNHLMQQGVMVNKVDFYERKIPCNIAHEVAILLDNPAPKMVLISSEMAWQAWQRAVDEQGADVADFEYMVMGERLQVMIEQATAQPVLTVYNLHDTALAEAMTQWRLR